MVDFPIPSEDEDSSTKSSKSNSRGKMPDFIYIDDTQEFLHGSHSKLYPFEETEAKNLAKAQTSWGLRFLCLLGAFLSFIVAIGALVWTVIFFVITALLFFQSQSMNQSLRSFWNFYVNSSVVALGLGIAFFSPMLGFGLLLIYFSMKTKTIDSGLLKRILKNSFSKF